MKLKLESPPLELMRKNFNVGTLLFLVLVLLRRLLWIHGSTGSSTSVWVSTAAGYSGSNFQGTICIFLIFVLRLR